MKMPSENLKNLSLFSGFVSERIKAENFENSFNEVLSVSEVSEKLKRIIETNFFYIIVEGEVSGFKKHSSGHSYFSLKDARSVLKAIVWRGTKINFEIVDGMKIRVSGKISSYQLKSEYYIVVSSSEVAGVGNLLKVLELRKEKLRSEGLFSRKRGLPKFPKSIAVITSATGAVIRDIIHRISERFPLNLLIFPALVQGDGAAEEISKGISILNKLEAERKPDIIILARGGGSVEDLWAFNEEVVVRAIFASEILIVSAVGHETDTTLADYAADLRASTPTAAAELVTPDKRQIIIGVQKIGLRLFNSIKIIIEKLDLKLKIYKHKIPSYKIYINEKEMYLDDFSEKSILLLNVIFQKKLQKLVYVKNLLKAPIKLIEKNYMILESIFEKIIFNIKNLFKINEFKVTELKNRLSDNSYDKILKRGFCIVQSTKKINIKSSSEIISQKIEEVSLKFFDGVVSAKINKN